jgi:hypothetical protein
MAGRPVLNHDELNQYINQQVNDLRMNKRGIKALKKRPQPVDSSSASRPRKAPKKNPR